MIKKRFNQRKELLQKILLGIVNLGNLAVGFAVLSIPALWYNMRYFLNPSPPPPTPLDYVTDVILFSFQSLKYFMLAGSMAAFAYSFLTNDDKDRLFFSCTGAAMMALALYLSLGR